MMFPLYIFIFVVFVDVVVLLFDAMLKWIFKVPTISARIWEHKEFAIPLILFQLLGAIGLALHLLIPPK